MTPFTHLHVHTEYSLLDGSARIPALVARCKAAGMDALAITDHGVMYGAVDFYKAAVAEGIRPIIGCEVYMAARRMTDMESTDRESAHLVLLAEDQTGYRNLVKLVSMGFTQGFYYKPRIDYDTLARHARGLICLSACLAGDIPRLLSEGRYDSARELALRLSAMFGPERFYLEMQDHGIPEQRQMNAELKRLSDETGIPLVATNDVHYVERDDSEAHDVLLCIQTGKTVDDTDRLRFETREFYLKTPEEMETLFSWCPEALENTSRVAQRCKVDFDFSKTHLPAFQLEEGMDHAEYLRRLCEEGLRRRFKNPAPELYERLRYELDTVIRMGYTDYFLIVWDFIRKAREMGIEVGPGRGSGSGSLAAYCLEITEVDPIRFKLLFERFLNPERISMPDFDVDFCYERRQEVIDYVVEKYGQDRVTQIITFGTMAARAAIRDVGRALNMSYGDVDRIAKMVPMQLGITLEKAQEINPQLRERMEADPQVKRLVDMATRLEGLPRHASTHAAGIVIFNGPATDYVPLQRNGDIVTTQFPWTTIEELGLLKMDFLGLRTLTVIRDAADMVREGRGVALDIRNLDLGDPAVYRLISEGDTDGVFQLESAGMRAFMRELAPDRFEDIIAGISLYRPGPMDFIPRYLEGKRNPESTHYDHPLMVDALSETYGCMVYQEQVMQIVRDMAGYSMGRSDLVRRAMAKKKHHVMEEERRNFVYGLEQDGKIVVPGAIRNGVPEEVAHKVFDEMMDFASYAFPKGHATAYAIVAYRTAWLKCHYPVEFMAALMNSVMGQSGKIAAYIQYCRRHGIEVLPPDVNESGVRFTVEGRNIRFGLAAIRNVGQSAVRAVIAERERGGPYRDMGDFCERVGGDALNKRMLESLIKAGAFDGTGARRSQLMSVFESVLDGVHRDRQRNVKGQISLFDLAGDDESEFMVMPALPQIPEHPSRVLLAMEKEMTGVYISGHPLGEYRDEMQRFTINSLMFSGADEEEGQDARTPEVKDGQPVEMAGIITDKSLKSTRSNEMMAFVTLEDLYGSVEVIVFPAVMRRCEGFLETDSVVAVAGRVSIREGEDAKLIADSFRPLAGAVPGEARSAGTRVLLTFSERMRDFVCEAAIGAAARYPGACPVWIDDHRTGRRYRLNKDHWIEATEDALMCLRDILGTDSVRCVTDE
ncbi:MAG: DNA polymerase III subunit alpha [Clostridiales bacterium]|nr:DNA polymerase III subunit alpha [Clostridiales bacterium]